MATPDTPDAGKINVASDTRKTVKAIITPEAAYEWLTRAKFDTEKMRLSDDAPFRNRRFQRRHAERLSEDVKNNLWQDNEEPFRFLKNGILGDGYHRAAAVWLAGRAIVAPVSLGFTKAEIETVDTGKTRTFQDVLTMDGVPSAMQVAATAKLIYNIEKGTILQSGHQVSHSLLKRVIRKHSHIPDSVRLVQRTPFLQPLSVFAGIHCIAWESSPKKADFWMTELQEGTNLTKDSPVLQLRNRALGATRGTRERLRQVEWTALAIKSWNAYRRGESLRTLQWRSKGPGAEEFPEFA